jgi:hypothetical protein
MMMSWAVDLDLCPSGTRSDAHRPFLPVPVQLLTFVTSIDGVLWIWGALASAQAEMNLHFILLHPQGWNDHDLETGGKSRSGEYLETST